MSRWATAVRTLIRQTAVGALTLSTQAAWAQQEIPPRAGLIPAAARLESFVLREMEAKGIPAASVALVSGKEVVWAKGFGLARPAEKVPASALTVYRVGSVSKLFTAMAVMQLVERGELDLDAPVTRYLPDFAPHGAAPAQVTLRQLLSHRSGLPRESPIGNYFDPTSPSLTATVQSLNASEFVFPPGTRTKYSNAAAAVAGRVIEVVRGEPFAETVKKTLLDPLGMTSSGFTRTPDMDRARARGQMWTYDGRTFEAPIFPLGTAPAGNLESTVVDLGRFLAALLDGGRGTGGAVLKAETLRAMWAAGDHEKDAAATRHYGLGFALSELDGVKRVGHGGTMYGFATDVSALPEEGLGVVVVVTLDCANGTATRVADYALRLLLASKHGRPLPALETTEPLVPGRARHLAGRFGAGDDAVELRAQGGRLFLTRGRGGFRLELRARGGTILADDPLDFGARVVPGEGRLTVDGAALPRTPDREPEPPPDHWRGLIGEYGWDHNTLYILERDQRLYVLIEWFFLYPIEEVGPDTFAFPGRGLYEGESLKFERNAGGRATRVVAGGVVFPRRTLDGEDGSTLRIKPVRPLADLRRETAAAQPPAEAGTFRTPDLVEPAALDPTVLLDVRYATTNNFLGTPFYASPRSFLQRPAAEALIRAHLALNEHGFGLLIHDAYRPWSVTKMFWEATPESGRSFVADPSKGSKHNRGCAVDLTLYERSTGKPVTMVGGYDEFSTRSSPDYPGGTTLQRWRRDLLRRAMEDQGFTVNEVEWWHFDYKDWPKYPIMNIPFDVAAARRRVP